VARPALGLGRLSSGGGMCCAPPGGGGGLNRGWPVDRAKEGGLSIKEGEVELRASQRRRWDTEFLF
jgi:hypothetical protein